MSLRGNLTVSLFLALASCSGRPAPQPVAKNLILVSLDTLRADHTGAYGYDWGTTPNLDRIARESLVLGKMRSHAPETRDSHMAIFTSQHPFVHQRVGALPTLAEVLHESGFATVGLTDGGQVSHSFGFNRGFDLYVDKGGALARHVRDLDAWLDQRKPDQFFAFLHSYEIHEPYDPGPPFDWMYYPDYHGRVNAKESRTLLQAVRQIGAFRHGGYVKPMFDENDRRAFVSLYDGGIRKADEAIGRLYELLQRRGLLDDTLLVFISDHGEEFWDHGSVLHAHTVYEELLDIVGIVRFPGGQGAGKVRWTRVQGIDLAPTVLALLGARPMTTAAGSVLNLLEEGEDAPLYSEKRMNYALTVGHQKLIGDLTTTDQKLFDLLQDPGEQHPLDDAEAKAKMLDAVARVRGQIKQNVERFRVEYPPGTPAPLDPETIEQLRRLGYIE